MQYKQNLKKSKKILEPYVYVHTTQMQHKTYYKKWRKET
jgi:hypothetical protein